MSGSPHEAAPGRGRLITFEGGEGSGKSTQMARVVQRAREARLHVVATREPGGTDLGRQLRSLLLRPTDTPMSPLAELLLYVTDRAQHLTEVVEPALARGDLVFCDRYLDATLAYQGYGRGLAIESILDLHRPSPLDRRPDRTVLLDLEPELGLARARERDHRRSSAAREGRFEQEQLEFHRRVRDGYLRLADSDPQRFRRVDGSGEPHTVEARVVDALRDLVPALEA